MKLIKPHFEIIEQQPGLNGIYKQIELAGRTCYKSEDKITEDSAKAFVDRMIASGHGAMLEHGTVYLKVPYSDHKCAFPFENGYYEDCIGNYRHNKYSKVVQVWEDEDTAYDYVTTNLRVLVENDWLMDLEYVCEPTEHHAKRVTVRFICDRGILAEFTRHRVFSFAAESTRYCNYSKDKFNNELTFIEPCWEWYNPTRDGFSEFKTSLVNAENTYLYLIEHGWKPQQARAVLPNSLKTELVMTGFISDWKHFFMLRSNKYGKGGAHPSANELATPLYEEFVARGYI